MASLADRIERYLKERLAESEQGIIEIQRHCLADTFACVPSQINYVLATRFSPKQGYLVESRRGGGGYVRIVRIPLEGERELRQLIDQSLGRMVSQQAGEGLIERLWEEGFLSQRERLLMRAVIRAESLPLPLPERDLVRASILRSMLLTLLREDF
ncbi:MAG: CtsR family transcriptional regulator [Clostridia bacterium]|nr:CtsR family transcriptional regulator [Clostridia bacterium]